MSLSLSVTTDTKGSKSAVTLKPGKEGRAKYKRQRSRTGEFDKRRKKRPGSTRPKSEKKGKKKNIGRSKTPTGLTSPKTFSFDIDDEKSRAANVTPATNYEEAEENLLELDLENKENIQEVKDAFIRFKEALEEQEAVLLRKFNKFARPASQQLVPLKESLDSPESVRRKKFMIIDVDSVLFRISKIGFLKGRKFDELKNEQNKAIDKLRQIIKFEEDANKKRLRALQLQEEVDQEMKEIEEQQAIVEAQLAKARPFIERAKKAVSSIEKRHLDELRALKKPPPIIELVMTAVVGMVYGYDKHKKKAKSWRETLKLITFKFIKEILEFDSMKITTATIKKVGKEYLSHPEFNYERVNKASKVAGPMVLWIESQIEYAKLLIDVKPLIQRIEEYKKRMATRQKEMKDLKKTEKELDAKIANSRAEMLIMVGYRKIGDRYYMSRT